MNMGPQFSTQSNWDKVFQKKITIPIIIIILKEDIL